MMRYAVLFSFLLSLLGFASTTSAQVLSCTYEQNGVVKGFETKPPTLNFGFVSDENDTFLWMTTIEYPNVWVVKDFDTAPDGSVYFTGYEVASVYNEWEFRPFYKWGEITFDVIDHIWQNFSTDVYGIYKLNPKNCSVELVWEDTTPSALGQPAVSPDGTMIVFDDYTPGSGWGTRDLYVTNLDITYEPMKLELPGMGNFGADWGPQGIVFTHIDNYAEGAQEIWVKSHIGFEPIKYEVSGYQPHWTENGEIVFKEIKDGLGYEDWQPEFRILGHEALGMTGTFNLESGDVIYTDATTYNLSESGELWASLKPLNVPAIDGAWPVCPPSTIGVQTIESDLGEGITFTWIYSEGIDLETQAACQKETIEGSWAFKNGLIDENGDFIDD